VVIGADGILSGMGEGRGLMTTRFYLPKDALHSLTPAYSDSWEDVSEILRRQMHTFKGEGLDADFISVSEVSVLAQHDVAIFQFISKEQYRAFNFTTLHTVKLQIQANEAEGEADAVLYVIIKVVSSDGNTIRGILYEGEGATEFDNGVDNWENRSISANVQNAVNMQDGDYIVLELGVRFNNTETAIQIGREYYRDDSEIDLPENETDTAITKNPWLELSPTLDVYLCPVIFKVVSRARLFVVEARERIFESEIDEDR